MFGTILPGAFAGIFNSSLAQRGRGTAPAGRGGGGVSAYAELTVSSPSVTASRRHLPLAGEELGMLRVFAPSRDTIQRAAA